MGHRTGRADLPLHGGRVPPWLAARMARLGRVAAEAIVHHYGRDELLRRLSHPFWFQALGAVMGMDWHSSGVTTSVVGALKRGLAPIERELGLVVCGGRGRHSRKTPDELSRFGEATGVDGDALADASRLVAKVDSAAVQDGFELYLHGFIATDEGRWVVIQQGLADDRGQARRYHWLSDEVSDFVDAPHSAIEGAGGGQIFNLTDRRARGARRAQVELASAGPDAAIRELSRLPASALAGPERARPIPQLSLPGHHDVRASDVVGRRLQGNLAAAAERGPRDFAELLGVPGVGARTVRALALVAEVVHGAPSRFSDPARFSFAHGGKDGHPFPVPLRVYDETLGVLRRAVDAARLDQGDKLAAIRRLDEASRRLEREAAAPRAWAREDDATDGSALDVGALIEDERRRAPEFGGRTVFGRAGDRARAGRSGESAGKRRAPRESQSPAQSALRGAPKPSPKRRSASAREAQTQLALPLRKSRAQ